VNCLIELQYLPCVAYFACVSQGHVVTLEKHEHFIKQSYRNRCLINTAHGAERLTIPLTAKHGKVIITDVKIDYSQKWLNVHWRAIGSAYRKAPFFEHYEDDLFKILFRKHRFLYDMNLELLTLCLKWLNLDIEIRESTTYNKVPDLGLTDLRGIIHPKKSIGIGRIF
jgi:hypothetical protein